ncbi:MAG: hypothetical protein AB1649_34380, partial [Chloroflexota bacterium]
MLLPLTSIVDFIGLCVALWLAFYLLARGFPSPITLRTVVVLLALATFFLSASINLHLQISGSATLRAILLVVALSTLHDLTNKLLPQDTQHRTRWIVRAIYLFSLITVILLFSDRGAFVGESGNILYVGRMRLGPAYVLYGILQVVISIGILNHFRLGAKVGVGPQNRLALTASLLAVATVAYGIFALAISPPMPRLVQDALLLGSIVLLGLSVARYQTLVERRTTLQEFPVSFLAAFGLSAVFALIAWLWSSSALIVVLITALTILTLGVYDLAREFLDRLQHREESQFRRQLRQLEHTHAEQFSLQDRLHDGLILLCQVIAADGGFIAVKGNGQFTVAASHRSLSAGSSLPSSELTCDEIFQPLTELLRDIAWVAPAFEGRDQVAVIAIHSPKTKNQYSADDLDLLIEAADRIGKIVYLQSARPGQATDESGETQQTSLHASSDDLITTLVTSPDPEFVKLVEEALRNLSDVVTLGQSPLIGCLGINEETQIERGKSLKRCLTNAIEILKPEKPRPPEPLPREWYSYVVLHDAYMEDVPNREIMARLYISEGTFNRSRRHALRGVARHLLE